MTRGRFITIEGVEGVGKSTNINLIESLLKGKGHEVVVTREPGGTGMGERIRQILLDKDETGMTPQAELLLMFAARAQHVSEVVLPALDRGCWVISDRFTDSSYAYQGGGRELGTGQVAELETLVLGDFRPDLTIVLDVDVETGLKRATADNEADRFESERREFFERVRSVFVQLAEGDRYHLVDTGQALEDVQKDITAIVEAFCNDC